MIYLSNPNLSRGSITPTVQLELINKQGVVLSYLFGSDFKFEIVEAAILLPFPPGPELQYHALMFVHLL